MPGKLLFAVCGTCLLLAGCQTSQTTACPPGASLPAADKARAARLYRGLTAEQRAEAGPLYKFVDRIERTCAAMARVR